MDSAKANLASSVADEAADRQHLCDSCGHAPFFSSKALHAHRTIHQTRGDVTLLNGLTAVITRPDQFSDWICPEDECDYASPHLFGLGLGLGLPIHPPIFSGTRTGVSQ